MKHPPEFIDRIRLLYSSGLTQVEVGRSIGLDQRAVQKLMKRHLIPTRSAKRRERSLAERFWEKVDRRGANECWPWLGYVAPQGYGKMYIAPGVYEWAHRVSWLLATGCLPSEDLELDHVRARGCLRRDCVNPAHLEAVTHGINARRGVSWQMELHRLGRCSRGHPRSESCLRKGTNRVVYCKACRREDQRARKEKHDSQAQ